MSKSTPSNIPHFGVFNLRPFNPNHQQGRPIKPLKDKRDIRYSVAMNFHESNLVTKAKNLVKIKNAGVSRKEDLTPSVGVLMRMAIMAQLERLVAGEPLIRPSVDRGDITRHQAVNDMQELCDSVQNVTEAELGDLLNAALEGVEL